MKRSALAIALVMLTVSACATSPEPSQTASAEATAMTTLTLTSEVREVCGSIGGCAAYVSLRPSDRAVGLDVRLDYPAPGTAVLVAGALPPSVPARGYVIRTRLVAVSDAVNVGSPPEETDLAACETAFDVTGDVEVSIRAIFDGADCEISIGHTP